MLDPPVRDLRTCESRCRRCAPRLIAFVFVLAVLHSSKAITAQEGVPFPEMLPWELGSEIAAPGGDAYPLVEPNAVSTAAPAQPAIDAFAIPHHATGIAPPPVVVPSPESYPIPHVWHEQAWDWQLLPDGLIYRSYLAGFKEPRFHSFWAYEENEGVIWDIALGGRVGLVRFGSHDDVGPEGFQFDLEGAGFPRLMPEEESDLWAADFRAGAPLTFGIGPYQTKLAYYHLSSHLGDEYLLKHPTVTRFNYSRDVIVLGQSYYVTDDVRLYAEAGWAFYSDVAGEWEFQFGIDYSPMVYNGFRGTPFAGINGHLREEVDFSGNLDVQAGWQWRSADSGHLVRFGVEYFNGLSDQFSFFNQHENKVGLALWYDY
jgi:Protein of unknown function (DUF1207)